MMGRVPREGVYLEKVHFPLFTYIRRHMSILLLSILLQPDLNPPPLTEVEKLRLENLKMRDELDKLHKTSVETTRRTDDNTKKVEAVENKVTPAPLYERVETYLVMAFTGACAWLWKYMKRVMTFLWANHARLLAIGPAAQTIIGELNSVNAALQLGTRAQSMEDCVVVFKKIQGSIESIGRAVQSVVNANTPSNPPPAGSQ